jgi:hypothetical protein
MSWTALTLIAVEGEFNRHALSRLHQKRRVIRVARGVLRNLRGQAFEQLSQIHLCALGSLPEFNLQIFRGSVGILHRLAKMGEQANGLDDFLFLQGHDAAGPSSARGSA